MPRLTPPSSASIIFCVRLAVFTAAAAVVAVTIDEIACIAAENASAVEGPLSGHRAQAPGGELESQGVHRQALHWDGGGESPSSLVAVGTIFCVFCIGGVLSAVAFFIAARHCQECYFGGHYLMRSEAIVAGVLTIALCLFGVPLVVMFPAVPNGSYLTTLLILIRISQVLALAAILVQVGHLAQLRVDRVVAKAARGSMVRLGQPSPNQDFRMEEATKNLVSVAVGGGPDEPAGLDSGQVEVVVHDKPLGERPKLVHRITKEDLWEAKERLRKISIDTLDSVFAGFEMPQVARLDIPGDSFNISGRDNEKGTTQGDDDTEALLLLDGESHGGDDESAHAVEAEGIQNQNVGAEGFEREEDGENESVAENDEREDEVLDPTSHNTDDSAALPVGAEEIQSQNVGKEVSEREADEEHVSVVENDEQEDNSKHASDNEEIYPDPSSSLATSDDSFSD